MGIRQIVAALTVCLVTACGQTKKSNGVSEIVVEPTTINSIEMEGHSETLPLLVDTGRPELFVVYGRELVLG